MAMTFSVDLSQLYYLHILQNILITVSVSRRFSDCTVFTLPSVYAFIDHTYSGSVFRNFTDTSLRNMHIIIYGPTKRVAGGKEERRLVKSDEFVFRIRTTLI